MGRTGDVGWVVTKSVPTRQARRQERWTPLWRNPQLEEERAANFVDFRMHTEGKRG